MTYRAIICVILFFCFVYISVTIVTFREPVSTHNYHQLRHTLKTGDVILFCCKMSDSLEKIKYDLRTKLLGSEYGHAGLVMRETDGTLYVVECTDHMHTGHWSAVCANNRCRGGIRIIPMDILLAEYYLENNALFAILPIEANLDTSFVKSKLVRYADVIFEDKLTLVLTATLYFLVSKHLAHIVSDRLHDAHPKSRMMCSEFVYDLLYQCGLMDNYPGKLFWPQSFTDGTFRRLVKVPYGKLRKMFYHPTSNVE